MLSSLPRTGSSSGISSDTHKEPSHSSPWSQYPSKTSPLGQLVVPSSILSSHGPSQAPPPLHGPIPMLGWTPYPLLTPKPSLLPRALPSTAPASTKHIHSLKPLLPLSLSPQHPTEGPHGLTCSSAPASPDTSASKPSQAEGYFHSTMLMHAFRRGFCRVKQNRARAGRGATGGTGFLDFSFCCLFFTSSWAEAGSMVFLSQLFLPLLPTG